MEDGEAEDDREQDLAPLPVPHAESRWNVRTPAHREGNTALVADDETVLRADTGMSQALRVDLSLRRAAAARQILSTEPTVSVREFDRRIERLTRRRISESTAQGLMSRLRADLGRGAKAAEQAGRQAPLQLMPDAMAD